MATIHSHNNRWDNAKVVGYGKDSFTGQKDIVLVQHPHFGAVDLEFYNEPDTDGKCHNVGNAAYWLQLDQIDRQRLTAQAFLDQ